MVLPAWRPRKCSIARCPSLMESAQASSCAAPRGGERVHAAWRTARRDRPCRPDELAPLERAERPIEPAGVPRVEAEDGEALEEVVAVSRTLAEEQQDARAEEAARPASTGGRPLRATALRGTSVGRGRLEPCIRVASERSMTVAVAVARGSRGATPAIDGGPRAVARAGSIAAPRDVPVCLETLARDGRQVTHGGTYRTHRNALATRVRGVGARRVGGDQFLVDATVKR